MPEFVPRDATDLLDIHDLDTNAQTLTFTTSPARIGEMVSTLSPISPDDAESAAELSRRLGMPASSESYVVCSDPLNGVLFVERQTGRSAYRTPVGWEDDDCVGR